MDILEDYKLTSAERPEYMDKELDVISYEKTQLYLPDKKKPVFSKLKTTLTTHRLLLTCYKKPKVYKMISLPSLSNIEHIHSGIFNSATNKMKLISNGNTMFIHFHKKSDCEKLYNKLKSKLKERSWVTKTFEDMVDSRVDKNLKSDLSKSTLSKAGIAGISNRFQEKQKLQNETLHDGFKDIESLIQKAGDLVIIAERLSTSTEMNDSENQDFNAMLQNVGIVKFNKSSSGNMYTEELARELSDFLTNSKIMEKSRGIVSMIDLYMIYNRVRGTDLISPEDILTACQSFKSLGLPYILKIFGTGHGANKVKMILDEKIFNKKEINKGIFDIITKDQKKRVSVVDVSKEMKISLLLSKILLEEAEIEENLLIRDEDPQTGNVYFYKNYFRTFEPLDYTKFLK